MAAPKKATDDQILAALSECGSVQGAAKKLGISASTLYGRLDDEALAGEWKKRQYRRLGSELGEIHAGVPDAIRTLRELAEDSGPRDSVRMAAANRILELALKLRAEAGGNEDTDQTWDGAPAFQQHVVKSE